MLLAEVSPGFSDSFQQIPIFEKKFEFQSKNEVTFKHFFQTFQDEFQAFPALYR